MADKRDTELDLEPEERGAQEGVMHLRLPAVTFEFRSSTNSVTIASVIIGLIILVAAPLCLYISLVMASSENIDSVSGWWSDKDQATKHHVLTPGDPEIEYVGPEDYTNLCQPCPPCLDKTAPLSP